MKTVQINTSKPYKVEIGPGLLRECGARLRTVLGDCSLCIVSDDTVDALYGETAERSLRNAGYAVVRFVFPHGEASKTAETYLALLNFLAQHYLTRTDALVALGGGVVGDLCGFAAATYLRGIRFVQIPTTLLAAVDSSVGGKTAIDIPAGKNLVGAFHRPELVLCDTDLLRTLPADIYRDGCAEVIKYGVICDEAFFECLARTPVKEQEEEAIFRCVEIKRDIVSQDEFDRGMRALLNFGHTVGHAIEACSDFTISHGCGVALGMRAVSRASASLGRCTDDCAARINAILDVYGFPDQIPYSAEQLEAIALSDKKRAGDSITLIIPKAVGNCVTEKIPAAELKEFLLAGLNA